MSTKELGKSEGKAEGKSGGAQGVGGEGARWRRFGPYLSERQWGTVREDYSAQSDSWNHLPHDQARSRAYRWGEDGLLGICDDRALLCFALALWNGRDPILKERLFGLTGPEGNHGEDVKELYYYLDGTPNHTYLRALYKYPQGPFPYGHLVAENHRRGKDQPEFELLDTGVFDGNRYFDVMATYAKAAPEDILIRIDVCNRGPEEATLHVLPTVWFRNIWSWNQADGGGERARPRLWAEGQHAVRMEHPLLGAFRLTAAPGPAGGEPELLFTENETNAARLHGGSGPRHAKDAFHQWLVEGRTDAPNPEPQGTKAAFVYRLVLPPGGSGTLRLRLSAEGLVSADPLGPSFDQMLDRRQREADGFYAELGPPDLSEEERRVQRQAYASLFWTEQYYEYDVGRWLEGDPGQPPPPDQRRWGRNRDWHHVRCGDVISMPDKWEYPWFAVWDSAFHTVAYAKVDPAFARDQLLLFLDERYMHPNGQIPAYEFNFSDVNPPVHAWAVWCVYKMAAGPRDREFLRRAFHKLIINFTWWVNRKDREGRHLFSGGFLGLDNIGVFDRSHSLPTGGYLQQADGTAWMAFYCAQMLLIAVELAGEDPSYEDLAWKFFVHFVSIYDAVNAFGGQGLWHEGDGFYYDQIQLPDRRIVLPVRSMVGLIPLLAVDLFDEAALDRLPRFRARLEALLAERRDLGQGLTFMERPTHGHHAYRLLALPSRERLGRMLRYLLDENEFLSSFGVRSLSRIHGEQPFVFHVNGHEHRVDYAPGESPTYMFGGNSNWRGPIWLPMNFLLVEALERYHDFYLDTFTVEFPTGSGRHLTLAQVAHELALRVERIFLPDAQGHRPCHGGDPRYARDPHFKDLVLFYEYFHAETGKGLGASHQTGWTALIALFLEDLKRRISTSL